MPLRKPSCVNQTPLLFLGNRPHALIMSLAHIDPIQTPLLLWHEDCLEGALDEAISMIQDEHPSIIQFFESVVSHPYASVIPTFTSMMRLCIGTKKDIISIIYSFADKQLSIKYHTCGEPQGNSPVLEFRGDPSNAIDLITEQLDFFVQRHKRLPEPKMT